MIENIFSGVVASLIIIVITYITSCIFPKYKIIFLFKKMTESINIVPSKFEDVNADPYFNKTAFIPVGDSIALSKVFGVTSILKNNVEVKVNFVEDIEDFNRLKDSNMIVIGGPMYNKCARYVLEYVDDRLPLQFKRVIDGDYESVDIKYKEIVNRLDEETKFKASENYDGDHGFLLVIKNPWNNKKWIFLTAGLSPTSTNAVIDFINSMSFLKKLKFHNKEFQVIVKATNQDLYPNVQLVKEVIL